MIQFCFWAVQSTLLFCIINILRSVLLVFVFLEVHYSGSSCRFASLSAISGWYERLKDTTTFSQHVLKTNFLLPKIHAPQSILQFPYSNQGQESSILQSLLLLTLTRKLEIKLVIQVDKCAGVCETEIRKGKSFELNEKQLLRQISCSV